MTLLSFEYIAVELSLKVILEPIPIVTPFPYTPIDLIPAVIWVLFPNVATVFFEYTTVESFPKIILEFF